MAEATPWDQMSPRERDAALAELLGWSAWTRVYGGVDLCYLAPPGEDALTGLSPEARAACRQIPPSEARQHDGFPCMTTSWSEAGRVLDTMRERGWCGGIDASCDECRGRELAFQATFTGFGRPARAFVAESASGPEAIAHAAYLALSAEKTGRDPG